MAHDDLWMQYRDEIARFLRRRVSNPDDAEDLLQDVLLKVHQALPDLPQDTPLKPWLYRIARNTAVDFYRRRARNAKEAELNPDDLWYGREEDEPPHDLDRCIAPLLKALPEADAALLQAVDLGGQRQRDYASAHGLPYSTVKTRVQSARAGLRHVFDRCCAFQFDSQGRLMNYDPKSKGCSGC